MENTKLLILLFSLVVFINYVNYILPNRDKFSREIKLLERKIAKENSLNKEHIDIKKLTLPYDKLFFNGKKLNYSQSMGKFQEIVTDSAKNICKITNIKWSQIPVSQKWYDRLKINLSMECKPKEIFLFINRLRDKKKLFYIQNLRIYSFKKDKILRISMQLVSYRTHNAK